MKRLDTLTPEQQALFPAIREQWITKALGGSTELDKDRAFKGIDFVYTLAKLKTPQFKIIVDSPYGLQYAANLIPIIFQAMKKMKKWKLELET